MGQRSGRCVGCRAGDIKEMEQLTKYAYEPRGGVGGKSQLPNVNPGNMVAYVIEYLDGCNCPATMKRIKKDYGLDNNNYIVPAVKGANKLGAVRIIGGSGKNRYELTDHGRELANAIAFVREQF